MYIIFMLGGWLDVCWAAHQAATAGQTARALVFAFVGGVRACCLGERGLHVEWGAPLYM